MDATLETRLADAAQKLTDEWIPAAWLAPRDKLRDVVKTLRADILGLLAQPFMRSFQEARVLTPDEQNTLALTVASSRRFKALQGAFYDAGGSVVASGNKALRGLIPTIGEAFAKAFEDSTPEGIEFMAEVEPDIAASVGLLRAGGFTLAENVSGTFQDAWRRVTAQIILNVSEHGAAAIASQAFSDAYDGIFSGMESRLFQHFVNLGIMLDKAVEQDLSEIRSAKDEA